MRIRWTMIESGCSSGAEQPDDEVVVVAVEPVAGEPDVVAEAGAPERHPDAAVLHEDRVLLAPRELLERAGATQRVPDRPRQRGVEDAPARPLDERLLEVLLVPDRVRAAEHRELGLRLELGERRRLQERAVLGDERLRRLAQREQRDAGRIVHVLVEHAATPAASSADDQRSGVPRTAVRVELHEEPAVERRRLAVRRAAVLRDVDAFELAPSGRSSTRAFTARSGATPQRPSRGT